MVQQSSLSKNDRFAEVLVIAVTILGLGLGTVFIRSTSLQTWQYVSREAGIEAQYPAGWLVDEGGSYLARLRDPLARPFKNQIVITISPNTSNPTTIRTILDNLTFQRSVELAAYRVLSIDEPASNASTFTRMRYTFVDTDPNPFIERVPTVVLGLDVVIPDGDRVIVVTFMADENSFNADLPVFERFITSMIY